MTAYLGIDPGLSGALAYINADSIHAFPVPVAGKEIDVQSIITWIESKPSVSVACIEKVSAFPGQGVSSMFKFGFVTGVLHGVIRALGIPLYIITPQAWKKEILAGTDKSKQAAIDYCLRAYPNVSLFRKPTSRTYDDGIADAICLAEYGKRRYK